MTVGAVESQYKMALSKGCLSRFYYYKIWTNVYIYSFEDYSLICGIFKLLFTCGSHDYYKF